MLETLPPFRIILYWTTLERDTIGLIVDLLAFLRRKIGEHFHRAHLPGLDHRISEDAVMLALPHQQRLAVRAEHDAVGVAEAGCDQMRDALRIDIVDGTDGFVLRTAGIGEVEAALGV